MGKAARLNAQRRADHAESSPVQRYAAGVCTHCGIHRHPPGQAWCDQCGQAGRAHSRYRRQKPCGPDGSGSV